MKTEIIAGHTFIEESYPIRDIGSGVISKGQAVRHFEKKHPEYQVVSVSNFKINYQDDTISVRVSVKKKWVNLPDDNQKPQKLLLSPGYDELKKNYDALLLDYKNRSEEIVKLTADPFSACPHCKENMKLKEELVKQYEVTDGLTILHEKSCERYDVLVEAISKDAQKFSDLLAENENLKRQVVALAECAEIDLSPKDLENLGEQEDGPFSISAPTAEEVAAAAIEVLEDEANLSLNDKESIKIGEEVFQIRSYSKEDAADLAAAKEAMKDDDSVPLSEVEMTGADGSKIEGEKPEGGVRGDRSKEITVADPGPTGEPELADGPADCDSDCANCTSGACKVGTDSNTVLTQDAVEKACDQADCVGSDEADDVQGDHDAE